MEEKLDHIIKQLDEIKSSKQSMEENLKNKIESLEDQSQKLTAQLTIFKNESEQQKSKILFLDKQVRRRNLILYGLSEPTGESPIALREMVFELINSHMRLNTLRYEFDAIYRIGIKKRSGRPRPVMIRMISEIKKSVILRMSRALKRYKLFLTEDYNRDVLEKRRMLRPLVRRLRQTSRNVVLHRDKIYVNGKLYNESKIQQEMDLAELGATPPVLRANPPVNDDIQILRASINPRRTVRVIPTCTPDDLQIIEPPPVPERRISIVTLDEN